jgi:mono/diheme cytochrome c family protein
MVPRAASHRFLLTALVAAPLATAAAVALAQAPASTATAPAAGDKPYTVTDGTKVDPFTMKGFRTWRAAACDRCHGPNQEGLVGPSLIDGLKVLSKDDFKKTVHDGRLEKGMPSFADNPGVVDSLDNLYAYLKGRSDGAITSARVTEAP